MLNLARKGKERDGSRFWILLRDECEFEGRRKKQEIKIQKISENT